MSTFTQILYHIVFSTKERYRTLNLSKRDEILGYLWGVLKNHKSYVYQMDMMDDHIHVLCSIHPQQCLSDFVKLMKASLGNWMKENDVCPSFRGWQNGYGAFSITWRDRKPIMDYIKHQQEHHKLFSSKEEYKQMLHNAGVDFNEDYI